MNYSDLLKYLGKYGTTKDDIIEREGFNDILENVVIAPWWSHSIFEKHVDKITQKTDRVFNIYVDNLEFSFIELKNVGASAILDDVLSLGVTKCKNLIFIGSAGAIDDNIKIGDIVIPKYSFCGVGTERYLDKNLEDNFECKNFPDKKLTEKILISSKKYTNQANVLHLPNYSVDCVFAQFPHIDHIISLGAKTLEMETSTVFKCSQMTGIKATALLCISDNTTKKKSLYSGRTMQDQEKRYFVRNEIIPKIIIDTFSK